MYGALSRSDGDLYWQRVRGTHRAAILVRLTGVGTSKTRAELLYGDASLWRYATSRKGASWSLVPNGMGGAGKYGAAGVGNPWNQYAWSMAVYGDSLYLGTWDSRTVAEGSSRVADGKIGRAHV